MPERNNKTCTACRIRRIGCYQGSFKDNGPCERCEKRGIPCISPEGGEPKSKPVTPPPTAADIKSQLSRLSTLLSNVQEDGEESPIASTSGCTVEYFDAIGDMVKFCLEEDIVMRRENMPARDQDRCRLALHMQERFRLLPPTPPRKPPPYAHLSDADLRTLIARMPPWHEVHPMLFEAYPRHWSFTYDCLFLPDWPLMVQSLFQNAFLPTPHAHTVAEIFAVLATIKACFARGHQAEETLQRDSDHFAACAKRALDILPTHEHPTIQAARALNLLSAREVLFAPGTDAMNEGLRHLGDALTLAAQLGFNRRDSEFKNESRQDAFQRKALIMSLTRNHWNCNTAYAREALIDPRKIRPSLPEDLRDQELTEEAQHSPWRLPSVVMSSLRARYEMTKLQQEVVRIFYADRLVCDYDQVADYSSRISQVELGLPESWWVREDPTTREMSFTVPNEHVPKHEVSARYQTTAQLAKLGMSLHRPLAALCGRAQMLPERYDIAWHRRELLRFSRMMLQNIVSFAQRINIVFVAFWCSGFDAVIATAMLLAAEPKDPAAPVSRALLQQVTAYMSMPHAPLAAKKVAATAQHLISLSPDQLAELTAPRKPPPNPVLLRAKRPRNSVGPYAGALNGYVLPPRSSTDPATAPINMPTLPLNFLNAHAPGGPYSPEQRALLASRGPFLSGNSPHSMPMPNGSYDIGTPVSLSSASSPSSDNSASYEASPSGPRSNVQPVANMPFLTLGPTGAGRRGSMDDVNVGTHHINMVDDGPMLRRRSAPHQLRPFAPLSSDLTLTAPLVPPMPMPMPTIAASPIPTPSLKPSLDAMPTLAPSLSLANGWTDLLKSPGETHHVVPPFFVSNGYASEPSGLHAALPSSMF